MTMILAIDPGSARSGWVAYCPEYTGRPVQLFGLEGNDAVLAMLRALGRAPGHAPVIVVIEWTAPRGMPASEELFETMFWAGRFAEAAHHLPVERLQRREVKRHLCGTFAAKDPNVRQALIDRFGGVGGKAAAIGLKATPGPLYGISADEWSALAVAVTWADQHP